MKSFFLDAPSNHQATQTHHHSITSQKTQILVIMNKENWNNRKELVMDHILALCQQAFVRTKEKHMKMKSVKTASP